MLIFLVCVWLHITLAEEVCLADPELTKQPIQIAFLIDRTVVTPESGDWILFQNETIHHLLPVIEKQFPGSEYAVTAFANWPNDGQLYSEEELENCYTTVLPFTRDQSNVIKSVNSIKQWQDQFTESGGGSYYALMSTSVDSRLGWKGDNKEVRKVLVLFTDIYPLLEMKVPGTRTAAKGDGSDTCSKSLPPYPSDNEMEWALVRNEVLVVGVFLNGHYIHYYDENFDYLHVPYIRYIIPEDGREVNPENLRNYDYKSLANTIVNDIFEDLRICDYNDPPAYNTFGL